MVSVLQIANIGSRRQQRQSRSQWPKDGAMSFLFSTHHACSIPNVEDSLYYTVTILHLEVTRNIDDHVIINFLRRHEVLTHYSFVQIVLEAVLVFYKAFYQLFVTMIYTFNYAFSLQLIKP